MEGKMEWLEKLKEERRLETPDSAEIDARIQAEGGGYEVHQMTDEEGNILDEPVLVAAGDAKGSYTLA